MAYYPSSIQNQIGFEQIPSYIARSPTTDRDVIIRIKQENELNLCIQTALPGRLMIDTIEITIPDEEKDQFIRYLEQTAMMLKNSI